MTLKTKANKAKAKTGVYTLTRDGDGFGDFLLWEENPKLARSRSGVWTGACSGEVGEERALYLFSIEAGTPEARMFPFPAIRKGTRARVRVTVEVIDE